MTGFSHSTPVQYEIRVKGHLDGRWSSTFDGFSLTTGFAEDGIPFTSIQGTVADQAALHGMLRVIRDMGLQLLSVNRVIPDDDSDRIDPSEEFQ